MASICVSAPRWRASRSPRRRRLLAWTDTLIRVPTVTAHQDGALIGRRRLPWAASPGRVFRIPAGLIAGRDPRGAGGNSARISSVEVVWAPWRSMDGVNSTEVWVRAANTMIPTKKPTSTVNAVGTRQSRWPPVRDWM